MHAYCVYVFIFNCLFSINFLDTHKLDLLFLSFTFEFGLGTFPSPLRNAKGL